MGVPDAGPSSSATAGAPATGEEDFAARGDQRLDRPGTAPASDHLPIRTWGRVREVQTARTRCSSDRDSQPYSKRGRDLSTLVSHVRSLSAPTVSDRTGVSQWPDWI
jgi:hypothetical protein